MKLKNAQSTKRGPWLELELLISKLRNDIHFSKCVILGLLLWDQSPLSNLCKQYLKYLYTKEKGHSPYDNDDHDVLYIHKHNEANMVGNLYITCAY